MWDEKLGKWENQAMGGDHDGIHIVLSWMRAVYVFNAALLCYSFDRETEQMFYHLLL